MNTREYLPSDNPEEDSQRIWRLITLQQAETLLKKDRKLNEKYIILDGYVKTYLSDIWLERSRWISRQIAARKSEHER